MRLRYKIIYFVTFIFGLLWINNASLCAKKRNLSANNKDAETQGSKYIYPPFAARYYDEGNKFREYYLYPLGHATYENNHLYWRALLGLFNYDIYSYKEQSYSEGKFFPIYFFKKGFGKSNDYAAVWPLGGTVKNFFGKERADWFLWPIWVKTTRGKTLNYWSPWPFVNYRCGASHGFGLWPMGGHFYQTGVYDDRYMLWPLIYNRKDFNKSSVRKGFIPFYAYEKTPNIRDLSIIWPIWGHRYVYDKHYEEHRILWPLFVQAEGDEHLTCRWAPFYTYSENKKMKSNKRWYLWPFVKEQHWQDKGIDFYQEQFLYFVFWHQEQKNHITGKFLGNKIHFWPIYSYGNNGQGHEQLQIFSPFEVFFQRNQMIRDLYTPLFHLFRYDKNNDTVTQSFLFDWIREEQSSNNKHFRWGFLIDYKNTAEEKSFSLLKGLLECKKIKDEKSCRLFWIKLKSSKKATKDCKLL